MTAFSLRAWQAESLIEIDAAILANKRPVVISATGTGKTIVCAFVAKKHSPCVVVVPTQNLVVQTVKGFAKAGIEAGHFYGKRKEIRDIIVCCRPSLGQLSGKLEGRKVGIILDECHQDPKTLRDALAKIDVSWLIGLSATAFHADKNETLTLHDSYIWGCSLARGLEDGILCPWRFIHRKKNGQPIECDPGTEAIDLAVIEDILAHCPKGPGIITAATITDAHTFAARLTAAGIPAAGISGKDSQKAQDALLADLESGKLAYLVQVKLLGEGVDLSFLRVVAFRDELNSRVRFIQVAGRAFRMHPRKQECLLIDPRLYSIRIGLNHDPRVGAQELDKALKDAVERGEVGPPPPVVLSGPVALSETGDWLARIWNAYIAAGYPPPDWSPWRPGWPTPTELAALKRKATPFQLSHLPAPIREPFKALVLEAPALSAADVGLLQAVLWSNSTWYSENARGFSFVHRKALLSALPGDLPEGCVSGLRALKGNLFENREGETPGEGG